MLRHCYFVFSETLPKGERSDDEDDGIECQWGHHRNVEIVSRPIGGKEASLDPNFRTNLKQFEIVDSANEKRHDKRNSKTGGEVEEHSRIVFLVLQLNGSADEGPKEIQAENRHPTEH